MEDASDPGLLDLFEEQITLIPGTGLGHRLAMCPCDRPGMDSESGVLANHDLRQYLIRPRSHRHAM
jgi:hypothetical protein